MGASYMIFATVGTHEQGFERLVRELDALKARGDIDDEIFIQIGYTQYLPKYCRYSRMICYEDMVKNASESRIYITHGGPASIFLGWQSGRIPIVVPRNSKYGEHVDDHQMFFTKRIESSKRILAVYEINNLGEKLKNYDSLVEECNIPPMPNGISGLAEKLDKYCRRDSE